MSKMILIVDDQEQARRKIRIFLQELGFAVLEAEDGSQGLTAIESNPNISLILVDFHMPVMNGLEMCEALQSKGNKIPIFMVTTEANSALKAKGKQAGIRAWVQKPVDLNVLQGALKAMGLH